MMRRLFWIVCILLCCQNTAGVLAADSVPEEVARFLAQGEVVGTVSFSGQSAKLASTAKAELKRMADRLKTMATQDNVLRVEGFAPPDGENSNFSLAISRARSVVQFLREEYGWKKAIYYIGIEQGVSAGENGDRVDLVLYPNPWKSNAESMKALSQFFD